MEHAEIIKNMIHDIISDRQAQAEVALHDYFVAKSREVTGMAVQGTNQEKTDEPSSED